MIPYGRQTIEADDIEAVRAALDSNFLTQGPGVVEFESALNKTCGSKYSVAVNSGTAALHAAYFAAGLKPGDEVIMPANTFVATANAALYLGAKPVFCDIRLDTYNIDENKIEGLINKNTKAIVPVHFAGHPCEMDKISEIAKKYNLLVIEDAAHAIGASYENSPIGSGVYADLCAFSFHPVKSITTGEGGAVLTNNKNFYERLLAFRSHGIVKDESQMSGNDGPWYFEMQYLGFNYRLTDIQCALGVSQLKKLTRFIKTRQSIAREYTKRLKDVPGIILPTIDENVLHPWHLFVVRVDSAKRKKLVEYLHKVGVMVQVHYIPVHRHPYYQKLGYKNLNLSNTEKYYETCLSLPIYPLLSSKDLEFIVNKLKEGLTVV